MKEPEPNDPMELVCERIPGDTGFLVRCLVEEFAQIGYGAEDLLTLFTEPVYPLLNGILRTEGETSVRALIEEVLAGCGTLRVKVQSGIAAAVCKEAANGEGS